MVLKAWNQKDKVLVGVDYIGTKQNLLADAISRQDLKLFTETIQRTKLTEKYPLLLQERKPNQTHMRRWTNAVERMIECLGIQ